MIRYLSNLTMGKMILWCYLIWYCVILAFYFEGSARIWLNAVGISIIIGIALILSVSGHTKKKQDPWQTFRLFLMPFCVSSFSSLIKDQGFFLIIPPKAFETSVAILSCLLFITFVLLVKFFSSRVDT